MKQQMCSRCGERPAVVFIQKMENDKVTPEGLCIKCARELNIGSINQMIDKLGISDEEIEAASEQMANLMENMGDFDMDSLGEMFNPENFDGAQTMPFSDLINGALSTNDEVDKDELANQVNDSSGKKRKRGKKNGKDDSRKFLNTYCTNLTDRAKQGKIDNIIGRENEISRAIQILCRRTKNNPCLIGEPGVGKTAIAEGLAIKIAKGEVPARLADKEIYLLDLTALVAGTQFRGQFEGRIKGLVDEVKHEGNIILFIDEVHNLVGTGDSEGTMNAANILKPALSRGEIQVIGATTFNEYRKYIEKDAALERRFQPIKVEEPSIDDAYKMLVGIKGYYEDYHKVQISDSLVYKAVTMSERYVTDRYLPDKAIDLLDESCTSANLRNPAISQYQMALERKNLLETNIDNLSNPEDNEEIDYELVTKLKSEVLQLDEKLAELKEKAADNQVLEADLAKVISLWTGIPATKIEQNDVKKLANLENELKEHIIGQDVAIEKVANAVRRGRVNISPKKRPQSFIFVGPTGVGKTELSKTLADAMFGNENSLIRVDMSEYMEKHSVSKMIGSPPGYVGYEEGGQLSEKVRRNPYSVILFDEIEKAHPDVFNVLLQILDDGVVTDSSGRKVDFKNTIIIMTSNAGAENIVSPKNLGFNTSKDPEQDYKNMKNKVMDEVKRIFKPEFLNRIDEMIVFHMLTKENVARIVDIMMNSINKRIKEQLNITIELSDAAKSYIVDAGYDEKYGARPLKRALQQKVEDELAEQILEGRIKSSDIVYVDKKEDSEKLVFSVK